MPVICGKHRKITSWLSSENLFVLKRSMDDKPKYPLPFFKLLIKLKVCDFFVLSRQ